MRVGERDCEPEQGDGNRRDECRFGEPVHLSDADVPPEEAVGLRPPETPKLNHEHER